MKNILLLALALFLHSSFAHAQIITTIAGNGSVGYNGDNITATNAELDGPYDVALDGLGNFYITDGYNNRIRKVDTAGIITTIAGNDTAGYNGDGIPATDAQLFRPVGIICDHFGNLYFADAFNNRVRKIDNAGIITTVAGNGTSSYNGDNILADTAGVYDPHSVALDASGNLYITDWGNSRIRKVNTAGIITTIAGTGVAGYTGDNGPATDAEINTPYGIALDNTSNIYFVDAYENVARKIDVSGIIKTFAGTGVSGYSGDNGPADSAILNGPGGIAIDGENNIYIADIGNQRIRKVTAATNIITTIAGDGIEGFSGDNGPATNAELNQPGGIAIDAAGDIYFADFSNTRIRYITSTLFVNSIINNRIGLKVFPNPAPDGQFTVYASSNYDEQMNIIITSLTGEKVKEITANTNQPIGVQIDVPVGIYYLTAFNSHGTNTQKLIINKCC